jgi:hypothetical protein
MIADLYHKRGMKRLEEVYGRYLKMLLAIVLTVIAYF